MKTKLLLSVKIATLLASLSLTSIAFAAAPRLAFQQTWGGPALDRASGIAVAPDGSIYLGGYTASFGAGAADGDWDVFLLKYNTAGSLIWQRTWGAGRTTEWEQSPQLHLTTSKKCLKGPGRQAHSSPHRMAQSPYRRALAPSRMGLC